MSNQSSLDPKVKFLSIALAVVLVLFWAFLIGFAWWFFDIRENTFAGGLLNWFARMHIVILHLPIGFLFVAIALELFAKVKGFEHVTLSVTFILWLTLLGAIVTSILGFVLMRVEEISGRAVTLHLWTGLGVVVASLFALIFKLKDVRPAYAFSLVAGALCVAATGHYGGALVHEADYLSEYAPKGLKPIMLAGLHDPKKDLLDEDWITVDDGAPEEHPVIPVGERQVYAHYVAPILEHTCNECHCETKVKGDLRMDTHEFLLAGAKDAELPTLVPGKPEESQMLARVLLPKDDEDVMPPKGDGLKPEEIAVLRLWIQAGAKTETTVAQLGDDPGILTTFAAVDTILEDNKKAKLAAAAVADLPSIWFSLSQEEQAARLAKVQAEAEKLNVSVSPVSAEDSRLSVSVLNGASEFGDEQLLFLEPVAERVAALDLAKSQITDDGLKSLAAMTGLEKLHLENTRITDAGIRHLTSLKNLSYLNLYTTDVSNAIFEHLKEMPSLRKVYVWQTKVDTEEARRYEKSVNLEINTGIDLEAAAAAGEAAKAKAEAEAAKAKAETEAAAKKAAEEAAAKKLAEEEAARKKAEAEAAAKPEPPATPQPVIPAPPL